MKSRLAAAKDRAYAASDPGFQEFELGLLALQDARQLGNSRAGRDTALLLYRAATRLLVRATLLRRAASPAAAGRADTSSNVSELPGWAALVAPRQGEAGGNWFDSAVASDDGESYLAKLSRAERELLLGPMKRVAEALADPLELDASLVQRLIWARRLRVLAAGILIAGGLVWAVGLVTQRPNLALHRPVIVSDRDPHFGVDPERLVDGDRLSIGFHTTQLARATATVDLGAVKPLTRIEVYNRSDCCQERATPLSVQVSSDGVAFKTIARQTDVFEHWTVKVPSETHARFVRLLHEGRDFFHLAEVEAY